jgi:hypothetical protein
MRHQYLTLITPSRLTKSLLRGLFLQDASIKSSLGGPNNVLFESCPIYTYFDFVEQLLSDLGPCAHWIVAMTSYFDYHHLKSLENGKLLYTALDSYSFAGTTWWEISVRSLETSEPNVLSPIRTIVTMSQHYPMVR